MRFSRCNFALFASSFQDQSLMPSNIKIVTFIFILFDEKILLPRIIVVMAFDTDRNDSRRNGFIEIFLLLTS